MEQVSRDSNPDSTAEAFGLSNGEATTNAEVPTEEVQEQVEQSELETESNETEVEETPQVEEPQDTNVDSELKRVVIDTIEDKLNSFDRGDITAEELRAWLDKNGEIKTIANKSKRVKERYRAFMEAKPTVKESSEESTDESKDKPLTLHDLKKFSEEQRLSEQNEQLQRERRRKIEKFASERNLKDESFEKFNKIAETLYNSADMEEDEAIQAAYNALYPSKSKPLHVNGTKISTPNTKDEDIDLESGAIVNLI